MRIPIVGLVVGCLYVASAMGQAGSSAGSNTQEINAQNANNVCRVYFSMPKPGMGLQYEAGRKKHMQFHRDQKRHGIPFLLRLATTPVRTLLLRADTPGKTLTSGKHAWERPILPMEPRI